MDDYFRETLRRLPLADAVLHVLGFALHDDFLEDCFQEHRGQCYEDVLSFPSLVHLLIDALLVYKGSPQQARLAAKKNDLLPTCREAFYGKLRRLPLDLSVAFL